VEVVAALFVRVVVERDGEPDSKSITTEATNGGDKGMTEVWGRELAAGIIVEGGGVCLPSEPMRLT
jgi:hypothetical protein